MMIEDLQRFEKIMGYKCNFANPKSHNEKVMWKKYKDRDPLLTITSDKIKVKGYVEDVLGKNTGMFSQRLYEGYDLADSVKYMNKPCVIKMNNASGRNIFISEANDKIISEAVSLIISKEWMTKKYGAEKDEWAYQDIKPGLVIEKKIFDSQHGCHRFLCFNGRVEYVQVHWYSDFKFLSVPNVSSVSTFDRDWELQEVTYKDYSIRNHPRPTRLDYLIKCSEKLSEPFNFCRIDYMLDENEKIYFGEITHYPVSGKCKFTPVSFDYKLGELW